MNTDKIVVTICQGDKKADFRLAPREYKMLRYVTDTTTDKVDEACMLAWGYFHLSKAKSKRFMKLFMGETYKQGDFTYKKKSLKKVG